MFAPPPKLFHISLASERIEELLNFYILIGICFHEETNEQGIKTYTYTNDFFSLQLRETLSHELPTSNLNLKFYIDDVDAYEEDLREIDIFIVKKPWSTEIGRHMIIKDYDGHTIELITKNNT